MKSTLKRYLYQIFKKFRIENDYLYISIQIIWYNFKAVLNRNFVYRKQIELIKGEHDISFVKRKIHMEEEDINITELIVTCYFTSKNDPQSFQQRGKADYIYIEPWYNSMIKLGLNGMVLHDGLEPEFISRYQTEKIKFRHCELGDFGIFEERWFLYNYLIDKLSGLKTIFFTDSNDVFVNNNPFLLIKKYSDYTLFIGRDNANRIKDSGWLLNEMQAYTSETGVCLPNTFKYQWLYNAGVIGGDVRIMRFFTKQFIELCKNIKTSYHKDMTVVNLIIHLYFYPKLSSKDWTRKLTNVHDDKLSSSKYIVSGFPLNSGFKEYDIHSKACFIHK